MNKDIISKDSTDIVILSSKTLLDITKDILKNSKDLVTAMEPPFLSIGHSDAVKSFLVTNDQKYLVTASDSDLKIWDIGNRACVETAKVIDEHFLKNVQILGFLSGEKYILIMANHSKIELWDFTNLKFVKTIYFADDFIKDAVLSPDKRKIALAGDKTGVNIIDIENQKCKQLLGELGVWMVTFLNNNELLISVALEDANEIRLFNISDAIYSKIFTGHTDIIFSIVLTSDKKHIISGSKDGTVRLWNIETTKCIRVFDTKRQINSVILSSDEKYIISGGRLVNSLWDYIGDGEGEKSAINIWDIESGQCIKSFNGYKDVKSLKLMKDGSHILAGRYFGVDMWNIISEKRMATFEGHLDYLFSAVYSNNGKYIISGSMDKINVWDAVSGEHIETIEDGMSGICIPNSVKTTDNILVASDSKIIIFDTEDKKRNNIYKINSEELSFNSFIKVVLSEKYLVANNYEGLVYIFDRHTTKLTNTINLGTYDGLDLLFSKSSKYLAISADNDIQLWDIDSNKCVKTLKGHTDSVCSLAMYSDTMVSASDDGAIKMWDINGTKCIKTYEGHTDMVGSLAIHEDIMVYGSSDGSIKVWDIDSSKCLKTLKGHDGGVDSISLSPDGKRIVSTGRDDIITVWDIEKGESLFSIYNYEDTPISMNEKGFFVASDKAIEKYIRTYNGTRCARELTQEEITHFRVKYF